MELFKHKFLTDYKQLEQPITAQAGYEYIVASNGIFLRAANRFFEAILPLRLLPRSMFIRGLLAAYSPKENGTYDTHKFKMFRKIPRVIYDELIRQAKTDEDNEQFFQVHYAPEKGFEIIKPQQKGNEASVKFESNQTNVFLEVHTHPFMRAFFSTIDDSDNQEFRLYAVIGYPNEKMPPMTIRLGIYGYFMNLDIEDIFDIFEEEKNEN